MNDAVTQPDARPGDDDLLARLEARLREARAHQGGWRENAREDYAFVAGDQWSAEDRQRLREQLRPVITFNRIAPIIDSVAGTEVNNRQEVRYVPRQPGDAGVNELLTGAAEWVRDQCDAEDEESDAFWDTLVGGMGWTETRLSYDEDPDGRILIERVDPLEMYWDPAARKRNLDDARYLIRVRLIDAAEFAALWPGRTGALGQREPEAGRPHVVDPRAWYEDDGGNDGPDTAGKVRVIEYQWAEAAYFWRLVDPATRRIVELDEAGYRRLARRFAAAGVRLAAVRQRRRVVRRAFVSGGTILEQGASPCPGAFTWQAVTGRRDRNAGTWHGLVRAMKDPQRWANKWLSQVLHIINANAKGGVVAEKDAVANVRRFEEDWAKPDAVTWLNPGAIAGNKLQPKPPIGWPEGLGNLMQFAVGAIRDVSGVNLELLGQADRTQPGVLEYQRKQSALSILATLFDSLRRYRKQQGRVLLYMIQHYISDGRLIRVAGQDGRARYVPLARQADIAAYDVIVDDAPSAPNQKERTWSILQGFLPMLMQMRFPPQIWAEVLRISPLPASFTDKLVALMQEAARPAPPAAPPPEIQAAQQQMQLMQQAAALDAHRPRSCGANWR